LLDKFLKSYQLKKFFLVGESGKLYMLKQYRQAIL
jgi:hypothetical protein